MREYNLRQPRSLLKQRGMFSLFITLIIIVAIGLLTYTMSNTTTVENRLTGSELRSKQAFHAAQAGLDYALQLFMDNNIAELNASCGEMIVDEDLDSSAQSTFQLRFGAASSDMAPQCPYMPLGLQTAVVVRSVGRALDSTAGLAVPEVRVLEVTIDLHREWELSAVGAGSTPAAVNGAAVVARGAVTIGGNGNAAPCEAISSCIDLARSGNQSQDISGVDTALIRAGSSISGGQTGNPDARLQDKHKASNDPMLAGMTAEAFFEHIMGMSKSDFQSGAEVVNTGSGAGASLLDSINLNPAVWVNGDLTLQGDVLGTPQNPVTLVVDGNLRITGNAIIWGIVYTTGSDFSAGNSKIFGSLVAENNITALTGTSSVFHNSDLASVQAGGGGGGGEYGAGVATVRAYFDTGSWREVPASAAFAVAAPGV
jgi:hypothetical protein